MMNDKNLRKQTFTANNERLTQLMFKYVKVSKIYVTIFAMLHDKSIVLDFFYKINSHAKCKHNGMFWVMLLIE